MHFKIEARLNKLWIQDYILSFQDHSEYYEYYTFDHAGVFFQHDTESFMNSDGKYLTSIWVM